MRTGYPSPRYSPLGVHFHCTGPDPRLPAPGERLKIVIYDKHDRVIRRLEQVKGACIDHGYVDFFLSPKCRPAVDEYHIVDIDADNRAEILATHFNPQQASAWLRANFTKWIMAHSPYAPRP